MIDMIEKLCNELEALIIAHRANFSDSEVQTVMDAIAQLRRRPSSKTRLEKVGMSFLNVMSKIDIDISELGDLLDKL
ncbi:MAG: hypothetical protein Roseis2KO_26270 [Roseivirga sp.]